jgi:hypothetical protein
MKASAVLGLDGTRVSNLGSTLRDLNVDTKGEWDVDSRTDHGERSN